MRSLTFDLRHRLLAYTQMQTFFGHSSDMIGRDVCLPIWTGNFLMPTLPVIARLWFSVPSGSSAPSHLYIDTNSWQRFCPSRASDLKPCRCQLKRRWIQAASNEPVSCKVQSRFTAGKQVAGIRVENCTRKNCMSAALWRVARHAWLVRMA